MEHGSNHRTIAQVRAEQVRSWSEVFGKYPRFGYTVLMLCRLGAQAWGAGFLFFALLMALFGNDVDHQRTHWDNVFVTVVLTLIGFYVSDLACRAARRAGLTDRLGSWSYVLGIVVVGVMYVYGWRA